MDKDFITKDGFITSCAKNVSQMNLFEFLWYYPQMNSFFGEYRKSNVFMFLLVLICPWIDEIYYTFKHNNFLDLTIHDLLSLILIFIITFSCLGPIFAFIISYIRINSAKKFCKKVNKN